MMLERQPDVLFKKAVTLTSGSRVLTFRVAQDLFSSHRVDVGSSFLLRTLAEAHPGRFDKVLDLGCGYGPIGLALASSHEGSRVHLVDRDALAVDYARQNTAINDLDNTDIYGSLGYDDVTADDFDLIAANIPGKAGEAVITSLLTDAVHYLRPGGLVAVVVVSPLGSVVAGILDTRPEIEVVLTRSRSGHAVFLYRFAAGYASDEATSAFERGVYDRDEAVFDFDGVEYSMTTAHGLPEFNSRSFHTELLLEGLRGVEGREVSFAVVFNPGLGHLPVVLWRMLTPVIAIVDRDLLSLRYSVKNLVRNGCPGEYVTLSHRVGVVPEDGESADRVGDPTDLIIGVLPEKAGPGWSSLIADQAAGRLERNGFMIVSGRSTDITRFAAVVEGGRLKVIERKRWKGQSRLILRRR